MDSSFTWLLKKHGPSILHYTLPKKIKINNWIITTTQIISKTFLEYDHQVNDWYSIEQWLIKAKSNEAHQKKQTKNNCKHCSVWLINKQRNTHKALQQCMSTKLYYKDFEREKSSKM